MADTTLSPTGLVQPEVGASADSWGDKLNAALAIINGWFSDVGGAPALKVANGGTGAVTASAARTALGLGTIATQAASAVAITGGTVSGITDITVADGGTGASTASAARTNLGVVIGTDVQAYDVDLAAIAGLTSAANKIPYFTGAGTAAVTDFTAVARTLVNQTTQALMRTTGLGLGTAATQDTGTSGPTIPLMNGTNTWSTAQTFNDSAGGPASYVFGSAAGWSLASTGILGITSANTGMSISRISSDGKVMSFYRAGVEVGSVSVTGSATAYNTSSDGRLKTNVADSEPAASLALINSVRLRDFDWIADGSRDRGVLAHELQAVKPSAVTGAKGGVEMQAVDYSKMVPDLIGAAQALSAEIVVLRRRVLALEAR